MTALTALAGFLTLLFFPLPLRADSAPLRKAAAELAAELRRLENARIAVLALPHHDRRVSEGPQQVSDQLTSYLAADRRLQVLERARIHDVLAELRLSETGALDAKTARRIGQALDANVLVTGTIIDLDNVASEVNVRAVMADSGRVVAAGNALVERWWRRRQVLGR